MVIQYGTLPRRTFQSNDTTFNLYHLRCYGGKYTSALYIGDNPPPPRKTVELELRGTWENHPKHGERFIISDWKKAPPTDTDGERDVLVNSLRKL